MVRIHSAFKTHDVINQPTAFASANIFTANKVLISAIKREGADWAVEKLTRFGALTASPEVVEWGRLANVNPPILHTHDGYGNRIDQVEFHPAWHHLMRQAVEYGLHASPWSEPKPGAHVARAALMMLDAMNEAGHGCPISMTYAVVPALRKQPELAKEWEPRFFSTVHDQRFLPSAKKNGVLMGMMLTEKQGGSDVRANTTFAEPIGKIGPGSEYLLTGHKWFCSAPMCDAFLALAKTPSGLSCFLLPRWTPDGEVNNFFIQRLKDKMGNRSNATSEVEIDHAWARMVGEEGKGVRTILEMVNHTRLDCVISSTGIARKSLMLALHHGAERAAFGKKLQAHGLMKNVLADLAVESEGMILMMMRLARAYDSQNDVTSTAPSFRRIATAVAKYWICKRATAVIAEAMECLGGFGYVEDSILPRLYRESPVNSIWEGSGNVICLDVLRAMQKDERSLPALMAEIRLGKGADKRLDAFIDKLGSSLGNMDNLEGRARILVEQLALALQASLMVRFSTTDVADAFCASRLAEHRAFTFGALPTSTDFDAIISRARGNE